MTAQELNKERVEFATRREHFEQAFRLVYQEYLRKGYCLPNPWGMKSTLYNALPETVTFCLWRGTTLIATNSLIPDSPIGLPMESVYPDEVRQLRKQGRKLSEVSLLALNSEVISKGILPLYFAERLRCLYQIFKPLFWYAHGTARYTDFCIAVNPIHKPLYIALYFQQFGEEKVYESANGNPSIAMRLNFGGLEEKMRGKVLGIHKLFFGKSLELKKISEFFRWSAQDFNYFFVENSDVLKKAKPEQIEYLMRRFPELPIKQMAEQANAAPAYGQTSIGKCA